MVALYELPRSRQGLVRRSINTIHRRINNELESIYGGFGTVEEYLLGRADLIKVEERKAVKRDDADNLVTKYLLPALGKAKEYDELSQNPTKPALSIYRKRLPDVVNIWLTDKSNKGYLLDAIVHYQDSEAAINLDTVPPVEDNLAIIIASIFKPTEIVRYSQGLIGQHRDDLASQKDNPTLVVPIRRTTSVLLQMVTDAQTDPILRRDLMETNVSEFLLPLRDFPNLDISQNIWEILIKQL